MEQTKALNALEPFVALTKSASAPRAAADLVTQATSNQNTYVFAELLQTPQIQALSQSPDYAPHLKLLEIFSHGTYADYTSTPNLPPLNPAQTLKLRQLSLLTLARDPQHNLTYYALQQQLDLNDARAVEDLVISAVYAGLLEAQLDPRNGVVHVSSVSPLRDLAPDSIPAMLGSLQTWSGRCTSTLADLDAQIAAIRADAARRHTDKKAWDMAQAALMDAEKNGGGGNGGAGGGRGGEQQQQGAHTRGQAGILNRAITHMQQQGQQRFGKRGSGSLEPGQDDDEAMDLDEEEPDDGEGGGSGAVAGGPGKKRISRRKL
ncbi:Uu.00g032690.m01.CDS01 [Anthostomella pinea]|uniref:Uu.00g032690.m01.CDS01 n=1 Tax=Anthostomella pinea TaxID=933095 RepID=A0AAI8YD40_9PEZI|nr:Uu.00g032690.m01.CDS01 [Anthostomella pinea]